MFRRASCFRCSYFKKYADGLMGYCAYLDCKIDPSEPICDEEYED